MEIAFEFFQANVIQSLVCLVGEIALAGRMKKRRGNAARLQ